MSVYCNVKFCNLKFSRENLIKSIEEYNEEYKNYNHIDSIEEFLNNIGLEYDELNTENPDIIIPTIRGEYNEGMDFDSILQIIAKNVNNNERYILISHSYDYQENVKYVFYKGKVETISQVCSWSDGMDNDLC